MTDGLTQGLLHKKSLDGWFAHSALQYCRLASGPTVRDGQRARASAWFLCVGSLRELIEGFHASKSPVNASIGRRLGRSDIRYHEDS